LAIAFPASIDSLSNPSAADAMNSATVPHATQHSDANDAIEALEAKVGVDNSAVTTSLDYKTRRAPQAKFDHFADAGNGTTVETDLYSDTLAAGLLAANGDKAQARYAGVTVAHATATRQLRVYFGGTVVFDSTAQVTAAADDWHLDVLVVRVSASVVRCVTHLRDRNGVAFRPAQYAEVTGLTLTNTQILKITGQAAAAGAATNDIVSKLGHVRYAPAA
jgi:hypothetical protein